MTSMNGVQELQSGFYNAISSQLKPQSGLGGLQLFAGFPSLATSSVSRPQADALLWNYFNNIPPYSITWVITESGGNQFFSGYSGLLSALQATSNPNDPVLKADLAMMSYLGKQPDWSLGYLDLVQSLRAAPPIRFTSWDWNTDLSNTWTGGVNTVSPAYWEDSSIDRLIKQFVEAGVTLSVSFAHVLNFAPVPGNWYTPSAMALAYNNPAGTPWNPSSPVEWQNTFGSSGNLVRFLSSLVVVDTMNIMLASPATFSQKEQDAVESNSGKLSLCGESNDKNVCRSATFNPNGNMTLVITSQPGIPIAIGGFVVTTAQYLTLVTGSGETNSSG